MKFLSTTILSVALIACSVIAAPAERRASVSGTTKYSGYLYSVKLGQLGDYSNETQRGTPLTLGEDGYLTHSTFEDFFFFEESKADGWNQSPKEFGRVKYDDGSDQSLTADTDKQGSGHALRLQYDASSTGFDLDRQWFYANYINGVHGPYVTLQLNGNPNDNNQDYQLPFAAYYNNHDTATAKDTGHTYVLFNATILS
ncbi:uncharacterized protein FA14DRAFT_153892 [Meira miltonrushii]|uniref:Glycoside hydrolase 131 catalytic N-terminal domain-containing protein n=1 Tax=Meira miltonrushii TaxID=1280837 RepID=A0A316VQX2_9BASI|nr:uncharacterized protein FA14DRAFT_153892 [Meira miltonrushii]PWN38571.1 hypothetical protein FA14DRAFT_153892 [Meira miltonrushii]